MNNTNTNNNNNNNTYNDNNKQNNNNNNKNNNNNNNNISIIVRIVVFPLTFSNPSISFDLHLQPPVDLRHLQCSIVLFSTSFPHFGHHQSFGLYSNDSSRDSDSESETNFFL